MDRITSRERAAICRSLLRELRHLELMAMNAQSRYGLREGFRYPVHGLLFEVFYDNGTRGSCHVGDYEVEMYAQLISTGRGTLRRWFVESLIKKLIYVSSDLYKERMKHLEQITNPVLRDEL